MFKQICVGIFICILSLCLYQSLSNADDLKSIKDIEQKLDNIERLTERFKDQYNKIHGHVEDLIDAYDETEDAVAKGRDQIAFRAGSAVILTGAAYFSAGCLAPAAWMGWNAVKSGIETCTLDSSQYLDAIGAAIAALDQARSNMHAAYYGGWYWDYSGDITAEGFSYDASLQFYSGTKGYVKKWKEYPEALHQHSIAWTTSGLSTLKL